MSVNLTDLSLWQKGWILPILSRCISAMSVLLTEKCQFSALFSLDAQALHQPGLNHSASVMVNSEQTIDLCHEPR